MHPEEARKLFFKEVDNCYWNPKLSIKVAPNGDRTIVTSGALQKDEPLVVLNKNASFSAAKCIEHSKENISTIPKSIIIPAYLYQVYTKHGANVPDGYSYYFDSLPTYEWYAQNHELLKVYLQLTESRKEELKESCFLFDQINSLSEWAKQLPEHQLDKEQAIRSVLITMTRCWPSSIGLVPWLDFCNHHYDGSVLKNEGTTITASHEYEENEEVNVSYGLKDSLQLLNIYGYETKEKTVGIKFPSISTFALASDPSLKAYAHASASATCLLGKNLRNFDFFISHMRLCVFNKFDALAVSDLGTEYKTFLNERNELEALKLSLSIIQSTRKDIEELKTKTKEFMQTFPESFENDFKGKEEVLDNVIKKIYKHWLDLLKES